MFCSVCISFFDACLKDWPFRFRYLLGFFFPRKVYISYCQNCSDAGIFVCVFVYWVETFCGFPCPVWHVYIGGSYSAHFETVFPKEPMLPLSSCTCLYILNSGLCGLCSVQVQAFGWICIYVDYYLSFMAIDIHTIIIDYLFS